MLSRLTISQRLPSLFLVRVLLFLGVPSMALGQPLPPLTNPRTALEKYVGAPDKHYSFVVVDVKNEVLLTRYTIRMQSQKWDPGGEVLNRKIWEHGIALLVPRFIATDRGLLLIAGGSNDDEHARGGREPLKLIPHLKGRAVLRPGLPSVVEPGGGDVGMPEPLLHLGDISLVVVRTGS
jgi:PhoPQ-activated pathogenicity-related protein